MSFPEVRLRRLRQTPATAAVMRDAPAGPENSCGQSSSSRVRTAPTLAAMPGQQRLSTDRLLREVGPLARLGLGGVLIFGVVDASRKNADGTSASAERGVVQNRRGRAAP